MTLSSWGAHFGSGFGKYQTWVPCLVLPFENTLIKAFPENALLKSRKGWFLMYLLSGEILRGLRMMTLPPRGHSMSLPVCQALCKPSVYFAPFYSFLVGLGSRHSTGKQALWFISLHKGGTWDSDFPKEGGVQSMSGCYRSPFLASQSQQSPNPLGQSSIVMLVLDTLSFKSILGL